MKGALKEFFNKESSRYGQFAKQRDFIPSLRDKVNPLLKGRVLDVGSGCIFDFDRGRFDLYVAMDLSFGMLLGLERDEKVIAVCGDAHHLPFKDGTFNEVIYRSVLHHLNPEGKTLLEMEGVVKRILIEAKRILKRDGEILIVEPCPPLWIEKVESILIPLIRWVMRIFGVPFVFLFSKKRLSDILENGGWSLIEIAPVKGSGDNWDLIFPVIGFPFIKIPRGISPSTVHLFRGRR